VPAAGQAGGREKRGLKTQQKQTIFSQFYIAKFDLIKKESSLFDFVSLQQVFF